MRQADPRPFCEELPMPEDLRDLATLAMAGRLTVEETRAATYRATFEDTKGYGPSLYPTKPHPSPRPLQDDHEEDETFAARVREWEAHYERQVKAWSLLCADIKANNRARLDCAREAYAWAEANREWDLAHRIGHLLVSRYGQSLQGEDRRLAK